MIAAGAVDLGASFRRAATGQERPPIKVKNNALFLRRGDSYRHYSIV